ncbi:HAD superfamily hydrolase [Gigaspora margarita]|uniref:HAD superfamily hydrolase n=1 Tax=Gigaspora margarita TaxID=4874 RepID=A0A8H4AT16_GIGMA|nr:HAD superfamily hydrolase [Gigaspora margarita]
MNIWPKYTTIFDYDGIIGDTEPIYMLAINKICHEFGYYDYDEEYYCSQIGCNLEQSNQVLIDLLRCKTKKKVDHKHFSEVRLKHKPDFSYIELIPGVKKIVELYKRADWDLYIASNSSHDEFMQKTLNNSNKEMCDLIKNNFNLQNFVCGDDHSVNDKGKYGLINEKISIKPKDCLVFEDSFHGASSAKSFGFNVSFNLDMFNYTHNISKCHNKIIGGIGTEPKNESILR